jgi:hypothetical protein
MLLDEMFVKIDGEMHYQWRGWMKISRLDLSRVYIKWDSNRQFGIIKSIG